ncbi:MAG: flagellar motor protein MotB [Hasllibacter sp.]
MSDGSNRPLIVKRKKVVVEGGHHGGAWKVAYADFVTAMMAFFMLMWLLNATTESQRKGLADYFSPELPIARVSGGGDGAFSGNNPIASDDLPEQGGGVPGGTVSPRAPETAALEEALERLLGAGGEQAEADELLRHVTLRRTREGLVVELRDAPGRPLFDGDAPTADLARMLATIGELFNLVQNPVALRATGEGWAGRAARASSAARGLRSGGLADDRIERLDADAGDGPPLSIILMASGADR